MVQRSLSFEVEFPTRSTTVIAVRFQPLSKMEAKSGEVIQLQSLYIINIFMIFYYNEIYTKSP